jgi:hypothetical protein
MCQIKDLSVTWVLSGFLHGIFFYPEDGGDMFLRNVGWLSMELSTEYTALYPRSYYSSN